MLSKLIESAAYGVTKAVLEKAVELFQEPSTAQDVKTDPGLLERLKAKLKRKP
jgi:hypothetical protein